ncbi:MAG TPA: hypothetical protein VGC53_06100 [Vicinamibacteria bacterium]
MCRSFPLALLGVLAGLSWPAPCPAAQAQADETEQEEQVMDGSAKPELFLEGVIVASEAHRSVALLRRPGASFARAVAVGETLYGFELLEVSDNGIVVREGGEIRRLDLSGQWQAAPARAPKDPDPMAEPSAEPPASVRTELQRATVEARLSEEMPRILTQTGLTPRVLEGRVSGFRVTRLPGGTLLDDAGIRAGDVLLSINEISLDSPYTLIDLYPRLSAEDEIRVVLERAGHTVTYVYNFN